MNPGNVKVWRKGSGSEERKKKSNIVRLEKDRGPLQRGELGLPRTREREFTRPTVGRGSSVGGHGVVGLEIREITAFSFAEESIGKWPEQNCPL